MHHADGKAKVKLLASVRHAEEGGYWAEIPMLPGCYTQGDTWAELEDNLADVAAQWRESALPNGDSNPSHLPYPPDLDCVKNYYAKASDSDSALIGLAAAVFEHYSSNGEKAACACKPGDLVCEAAQGILQSAKDRAAGPEKTEMVFFDL